ncbi:MAG: winged helix DNA-binding domain-containing protein [Deltaproteobacteria bacterium]
MGDGGKRAPGWVRPQDFELAERLRRVRPRKDQGVLLSPFDPVLWDRARVRRLFGVDQVLEIFKPARQRVYGYYCLPVLAGEKLVARVDLKADRKIRKLYVLSYRFETDDAKRNVPPADRKALRSAVTRYAAAIGMQPVGLPQ